MTNDKTAAWVAGDAYDDENHKDDIPPYRRHGSCEGSGA